MYKLVIADDEQDIREGLTNVVQWEDLGFQVAGVFEDGRDVIRYIGQNEIDVILTDIVMSHASGLDVARWVSENRPDVYVVILSGYSEFDLARKAVEFGVKHYLLKPTKLEELHDVFTRVCTRLDRDRQSMDTSADVVRRYWALFIDLLLTGYADIDIPAHLLPLSGFGIGHEESVWTISVVICGNSSQTEIEDYLELLDKTLPEMPGRIYVLFSYRQHIIVLEQIHGAWAQDQAETSARERVGHAATTINNLFGTQLSLAAIVSSHSCIDLLSNPSIHRILLEGKQSLHIGRSAGGDGIQADADALISTAVRSFEAADWEEVDSVISSLLFFTDSFEATQPLRKLAFFLSLKMRRYYLKRQAVPEWLCDDRLYKDVLAAQPEQVALAIRKAVTQFAHDLQAAGVDAVNCVCAYVEEELETGKPSLEGAAEKVLLSQGYLSRIFKERTGITFREYVTKARVERAKELLRNPRFRVKEISNRLGYRDIRHFYRVFKSQVGTTATQYRKRIMAHGHGVE